MLADDGKQVTFRIKDYVSGKAGTETLTGEQFVRRFSLHILPRYLRRVRYAGIFQPRGREERLEACRKALQQDAPEAECENPDVPEQNRDLLADEDSSATRAEQTCGRCGAAMDRVGRLNGEVTMWLLRRVVQLTAALAGAAVDAVLDPLRAELESPGLGTELSYRQLQTFVVLTLVEKQVSESSQSPADSEASDQPIRSASATSGIPPPMKAVA